MTKVFRVSHTRARKTAAHFAARDSDAGNVCRAYLEIVAAVFRIADLSSERKTGAAGRAVSELRKLNRSRLHREPTPGVGGRDWQKSLRGLVQKLDAEAAE